MTDPRETHHIECDCVPHLGPPHCHLCSERAGREVQWTDCNTVPPADAKRDRKARPRAGEGAA